VLLGKTEELVHLLEGDASGLLQEEEYPKTHDDHPASEEEVCAISDTRDHVRSGAGNDELSQPLDCSSDSHADATNLDGEDFGSVNPRETVPRDAEEDGEDVNHGDGGNSSTSEVFTGGWFGNSDVGTNVVHGQASANGASYEDSSSGEAIDDEEAEHEGAEGFDDAVDTGGEKASGCALYTERFENRGRVVVDGVNTGQVLEDHDEAGSSETVSVTRESDLLEGTKASSDKTGLESDGVSDHGDFVDDVGVIRREVSKASEILDCLFVTTLLEQPSRRFGEEECTDTENTGGDELETDWNAPLNG